MSECAICYVTDLNFLLPTLVSAAGIRQYVPRHRADVFIFLIDQDAARIKELNETLAPRGILVVPLDSGCYRDGFDTANLDRSHLSHVPLAALGRFFIADALPHSYRRLIYLDGDTLFTRNPSRLIEASVPEGKMAAAEEMLSFRSAKPYLRSKGLDVGSYIANLGLRPRDGYFNSGVIAASRETWRELSADAFKFLATKTGACLNHDQSALNAVARGRRVHLSLKWNFQTPYKSLGMDRVIAPSVYHFTRSPKPWIGLVSPWRKSIVPTGKRSLCSHLFGCRSIARQAPSAATTHRTGGGALRSRRHFPRTSRRPHSA